MLSKMRRCPDCDYTWSRYLNYRSCPHCGSVIAEAEVRRELARLRFLQISLFSMLGLMGMLVLVWAIFYS